MLGTTLMSEIFHRNGFPTERTLAVIDFGDGTAIGVRAATNLLRPAHIFRYLKQGRHAETKAAVDYFLDRPKAHGGNRRAAQHRLDQHQTEGLWILNRVKQSARTTEKLLALFACGFTYVAMCSIAQWFPQLRNPWRDNDEALSA